MFDQQKITWDVQSYLERYSNDPYEQGKEFFISLLRIIKITKSTQVIIAFHAQNIPKEIHQILKNSNFEIQITNDYSEFANFTDAKTILVSKDRVFFQFLKFHKDTKILNLLFGNQFVYYTASALDCRYGYYYYKDYIFWAAAMKSQRLNFPGVKKSGPLHAYNFNQRKFKNNNVHRFYQRPYIFQPQYEKTYIPFKQNLFFECKQPNFEKLKEELQQYYPRLVPLLIRTQETLKRSKNAKIRLNQKNF